MSWFVNDKTVEQYNITIKEKTMKKVLVLIVAVMLCVGLASHATAEQTGDANFDTGFGFVDDYINDHQHAYDKYSLEARLGIGVDVTLYTFSGEVRAWGLESIEFQNKYDFLNNNYSGFIVAQLNAPSFVGKVFGR